MFLLDTNVVAETRKIVAGKADPRVVRWEKSVDASTMFLSALTLQEIEVGVLLAERRDPGKGAVLRSWFEARLLPTFEDRILPVDEKVARRCASLHVPHPRPPIDALIAATALVYGLRVVTRDVADFAPTGVEVINPWEA